MSRLERSRELHKRAVRCIPWGTQTNAKKWRKVFPDVSPAFIERGRGCHIWDVDGNEYLDFKCALGPIVLGHADPDVNNAVKRQIDDGTLYNMAHPLEIELAEQIAEIVPCAKRVRFLKTGSDANCAAVRVARVVTGRDKIISLGYHGWNDVTNANREKIGGIPQASRELVLTGPINDSEALKKLFIAHDGQIALLIADLACHRSIPRKYVQDLKNLAHENGALLCFDEIITGFRYALGGAQEYFGVMPDLACFGKAIANGYSLSALCGRGDIMDEAFEKTIITGTYYGSTADLAAAKASIGKLLRHNVPALLWQRGQALQDAINRSAERHGLTIRAEGPSCISNLVAEDTEELAAFLMRLFVNGLYPGSSYWFVNYAHTDEELSAAFDIIDRTFSDVKHGK